MNPLKQSKGVQHSTKKIISICIDALLLNFIKHYSVAGSECWNEINHQLFDKLFYPYRL